LKAYCGQGFDSLRVHQMNKVYAVGVMQADLSDNSGNSPGQIIKASRLWFFFARFEDAEECVLQNQTDIFEYYYNVALIEEHYVYDPHDPEGATQKWNTPTQWWYEAIYPVVNTGKDDVGPQIRKMENPKIFEHIYCFWAG
jgi:hypothetical protein